MSKNQQNKLDAITLDSVVKPNTLFSDKEPVIDLNNISFISPSALVSLSAICHEIFRNGLKVKILINQKSLRTYLIRSGFQAENQKILDFSPKMRLSRVLTFNSFRG